VQNVLLHQKLPLTFEEEYFATVRQQNHVMSVGVIDVAAQRSRERDNPAGVFCFSFSPFLVFTLKSCAN